MYVWCSWVCGEGVRWGRLGVCGSAVVPCCGVWVILDLSCLGTLLSLELESSREGILYDEIYIMIIEQYLSMDTTLLMRAEILLYVYI